LTFKKGFLLIKLKTIMKKESISPEPKTELAYMPQIVQVKVIDIEKEKQIDPIFFYIIIDYNSSIQEKEIEKKFKHDVDMCGRIDWNKYEITFDIFYGDVQNGMAWTHDGLISKMLSLNNDRGRGLHTWKWTYKR